MSVKSFISVAALATVTGTLALSSAAHASITQYSTRATFNAASGATVIQSFNSFTPTVNAFNGHSFDFGDFSAIDGVNSSAGGSIVSPGVVNGSVEILGVVGIGRGELTFTFDFPITALGFDADNLADQRFDTLIFDNAAGDTVVVFDAVDQVRFWGFISDTPFTTFTIRQTGFSAGGSNSDGFTIDDVTYTPTPGAAALLGLGGLMASRRRRS